MYKVIIPIACLIAGICLGSLSACAGPVYTLKSFRGRCLTFTPGGISSNYSCGDQPSICNVYSDVISQDYASQAACIQACEKTYERLYQQNVIGTCRPTVRYGRDNCKNYCRYNYP